MIGRSPKTRFGHEFTRYVEGFIKSSLLFPKNGKSWVAVSAGLDSVALFSVLSWIFKKNNITLPGILHINHGTRLENDKEELLVRSMAREFKVDFKTIKLNLNNDLSNFELKAREERKKFFLASVSDNDVIYTAHHIDDSFEWSLMQNFKSSDLKSCLGIPVVNGPFCRPFMSVTKDHIKRFVESEKLLFFEDSSNHCHRYERNYLRENVIPKIKERYPKYLKHYVYRSNDLAKAQGRSIFRSETSDFRLFDDNFGGKILLNPSGKKDFKNAELPILNIIKTLSNRRRGVLRSQVKKIIDSAESLGSGGPLTFSGGIKGYVGYGMLYFLSDKNHQSFFLLDQEIDHHLKRGKVHSILELQEIWKQKILKKELNYPNLVFCLNPNKYLKKLIPSKKREHPLLPISTRRALDQGVWFQDFNRFFQLIRNRDGDKNLNRLFFAYY